MPKVEVEGAGTFDVEEGRRLVLAIEEEAGVDILHRCGGYARCTTCRVEYVNGGPERMTKADLEILRADRPIDSATHGSLNFARVLGGKLR